MSAFQLPYFILCLQKSSFTYSDEVRFLFFCLNFTLKGWIQKKTKFPYRMLIIIYFDVGE